MLKRFVGFTMDELGVICPVQGEDSGWTMRMLSREVFRLDTEDAIFVCTFWGNGCTLTLIQAGDTASHTKATEFDHVAAYDALPDLYERWFNATIQEQVDLWTEHAEKSRTALANAGLQS